MKSYSSFHKLIIFFSLIAGILLRFIWLEDMEWKWDEQWMYLHASDWANQHIWPEIGVMSGGGIVNTGVSTWPFIVFRYYHLDPVQMAFAVATLNSLGILIFYFALKKWKPEWSDLIIPGLAITSIHLLHIVFSRKIWAQDLLPFFTSIAFWGFVMRSRWIGVFSWAFGLAMTMQVHMSGFYLAASMIIAAIWYDGGIKKSFTWLWKISMFIVWFLLPSLTWFLNVISHSGNASTSISNIFKFEFFIRLLSDTLGINVFYSLGKSTQDFFAAPYNYLNFVFLFILAVILIIVIYKLFTKRQLRATIWQNRESKFLFLGYVIFPSILFTISGIPIRDHYMIVLFPMVQILFTIVVYHFQPKLISWILVCQFWISSNFLLFVHKQPQIHGDYGVPYSEQAKVKNPIPKSVPDQAP